MIESTQPMPYRASWILLAGPFIVLATAFAGSEAPVSSAPAAPAAWSVANLIAHASAHNSELRSYEAEVAAARGQRTQAGLWKNPELEAEYGARRVTDSEGLLQGDGFTRGIALSQTFEFPGKGTLRKAIAERQVEIAELGLAQFRLALAGQVRSLVMRQLAASAHAASAQEIFQRSQALLAMLKERPASGPVQLLELRIVEASLLELRKDAARAVQESDEARFELLALVGLPPSTPLAISGQLDPPLRPLDANRLAFAGLKHNLQLKIRIAELEKAVREVSAARLEAAPDFSIGPFFSQDRAGENEQNIGAQIAVTLPLWNWNQGNVETAQARQRQADALLLDARRKVESAVLRRCRSFELARKLLEDTPPNIIENFRESAELADRQYRLGAISVQLYLDVQREFLNAQERRNETVLEAWQNLLDLELLTGGRLTP